MPPSCPPSKWRTKQLGPSAEDRCIAGQLSADVKTCLLAEKSLFIIPYKKKKRLSWKFSPWIVCQMFGSLCEWNIELHRYMWEGADMSVTTLDATECFWQNMGRLSESHSHTHTHTHTHTHHPIRAIRNGLWSVQPFCRGHRNSAVKPDLCRLHVSMQMSHFGKHD